jgi:cysteine synthase
MSPIRPETVVADQTVLATTTARLKRNETLLPTFTQLRDPQTVPESVVEALRHIPSDDPHPLNLFRVHWHNDPVTGGFREVPDHAVLPPELTGVPSPIVVVFGDTFPMIQAHKVLPAYACLVPRLVTGRFNPEQHKAVWPSTGNYCRGGVAISRILGCRGVAVLPEGMSQERFDWLEDWVADSADIIRTPGTESNVKEIYDACARLGRDPENVIFNQFSEFGNYLAHYSVTGAALNKVFESVRANNPELTLSGFVATSGSAGTLAAGDFLKENHGSAIAVAEPVECPTLLYNGFGEHNIQGIGDKHIPYIHNAMNTDFVIGVSDRSSDALNVLFNSDHGRSYLAERKRFNPQLVEDTLSRLGLSSIANVLAAIKLSKYLKLTASDALITVATDGARMYHSERSKTVSADFNDRFDQMDAAETFGHHLAGVSTADVAELSFKDRERMFNLGYFTWVEQQGVEFSDFVARKDQSFWKDLRGLLPAWDAMIEKMNDR